MLAFCFIFFLIFSGIYTYLELPVFAFGFYGISKIALILGLMLVAYLLVYAIANRMDGSKLQKVKNAGREKKAVYYIAVGALFIWLANSFILPFLFSFPMWRNQDYRNLIGKVTESQFTKDINPIDLKHIRIVDIEMARKLAEKQIGENPALGSVATMGQLVLQKVKGELYYVAPLEHRGFWQWWENTQGTQGFIMVSATNPNDVKLIQEVNGKPVYNKYQPDAYFGDNLFRHIYMHGFATVGLYDRKFEVDDNLTPYWIVTMYNKKVGYRGSDAVGVITVHAQTGEIKSYPMNDIPKWIDRVQPEKFIYEQIEDWGEYVHGFWNSLFAKAGTLKPAHDDLDIIYGSDNKIYWYTGITSSGKDASTVGFMLVDSETKEAKWYKLSGAVENSAMKSAEGQVQQMGYRASFPILYNIDGVPTYIVSLKDKEGLLKSIAFVSVENYNIVGVGNDVQSAYRSYRQNLTGQVSANLVTKNKDKVTGLVTKFAQNINNGQSLYYMTVNGSNKIFVATSSVSPYIPLTAVNENVTIEYENRDGNIIDILSFKNNTMEK